MAVFLYLKIFCTTLKKQKTMKLCSNKSNATSYEKADRSINKRCNSENVEEVKEKNCARDRILSLPFLKIMIFTLLLWIIQCSTDVSYKNKISSFYSYAAMYVYIYMYAYMGI